MKQPRNVQTTSTEQRISPGPPHDMPDRGGSKPNCQSTSTMMPLNRTGHPVAAFGAKPGMGEVQCNSTKTPIGRAATSPYGPLSDTKPQVGFNGKKK